ncbi:MAG: hypothetical protein P4L82_03830 [Ancalomicrobiaceae bacterium]|nr:hypothetical protein [Ancalomicrobiaceae bacterium]
MSSASLNEADGPQANAPEVRGLRLLPALALLFGLSGWATAGYLYFVSLPDAASMQKVAYALDLVDRFGDSPAHQAYMRLGDEMKPWWDGIDELQRQIAATGGEDARATLIAKRDATLLKFIHDQHLDGDIDLLVASFDQFERCLQVGACDEDTLRRSISVDIKRIYRTFRPYIQSVRESGKPGDEDFGRDLEDLFFRFVG